MSATIASIMEMMMVICFGISWPLNIAKLWKSRTAQGTSLLFYFFIWIGYVFALTGKFSLIRYQAPQPWYETVHWYVMFFYFLNIAMITAGILIYFRNRFLDAKGAALQQSRKKGEFDYEHRHGTGQTCQ